MQALTSLSTSSAVVPLNGELVEATQELLRSSEFSSQFLESRMDLHEKVITSLSLELEEITLERDKLQRQIRAIVQQGNQAVFQHDLQMKELQKTHAELEQKIRDLTTQIDEKQKIVVEQKQKIAKLEAAVQTHFEQIASLNQKLNDAGPVYYLGGLIRSIERYVQENPGRAIQLGNILTLVTVAISAPFAGTAYHNLAGTIFTTGMSVGLTTAYTGLFRGLWNKKIRFF